MPPPKALRAISGWVSISRRPEPAGSFHSGELDVSADSAAWTRGSRGSGTRRVARRGVRRCSRWSRRASSGTALGAAARASPGLQPEAALTAPHRARIHPDRAAPGGEVDSVGVPGRFCLWILNYLRCVGNVFSFRFLHLHYRDTTLTGASANTAKHVSCARSLGTQHPGAHFPAGARAGSLREWRPSHTVPYPNPQTSVERILVRGRNSRSVHLVLIDNSVSLMSLVDIAWWRVLDPPHDITQNFKKIYP